LPLKKAIQKIALGGEGCLKNILTFSFNILPPPIQAEQPADVLLFFALAAERVCGG
jgi:hypothetical protein